jgi:hypothetical protein
MGTFMSRPNAVTSQQKGQLDVVADQHGVQEDKKKILVEKRDNVRERVERVKEKFQLVTGTKVELLLERLASELQSALEGLRSKAEAMLDACGEYDTGNLVWSEKERWRERIRGSPVLPPDVQLPPASDPPMPHDMKRAAVAFVRARSLYVLQADRVKLQIQEQFVQLRMEILQTLNEAAQLKSEALSEDTEWASLRAEILSFIERVQAFSQLEEATSIDGLRSLSFDRQSWERDIAALIRWVQSNISADAVRRSALSLADNDPTVQAAIDEIKNRRL